MLYKGNTKPSAGARINWGHPLSRGLVAAFPFNDGTGAPRDAVTGNLPTTIDPGSPIATPYGLGQRFLASTNFYYPFNFGPMQVFSVAYQVMNEDVNKAGTIFSFGSFAACVMTFQNKINLFFTNFAIMGVNDTALVNNQYHHGGVSYSNPDIRFYLNGMPDGSPSYAATFANTVFAVGQHATGVPYYLGPSNLIYLYIWNRVLPPSEFNLVAAQPYCFLASSSPGSVVLAQPAPVSGSAAKSDYYLYMQGFR